MPLEDALILLLIVSSGMIIAGVLAPLEALGWWAGWFEEVPQRPELDPAVINTRARQYVVFLSGIHSVSGKVYAAREIELLERLRQRLPDVELVDDVFPYSVVNRPLTAQRIFSRFWRWALKRKLSGPGLAGFLINLRNSWQVAVSTDSRYGPMYNQGSAEIIWKGLKKHGYYPNSGIPITLIGYSGGGQIAVGAAPYLKAMLSAPIRVISLGGVISSDPGILSLERLYHMYGDKDTVERIGVVFFPGRWPIFPLSHWNQAKSNGCIRFVSLGSAVHTGSKGYLDTKNRLPNGVTYMEQTVEAIVAILKER